MFVVCKQDSSEQAGVPPITVLINWKEGAARNQLQSLSRGLCRGAKGRGQARVDGSSSSTSHPPPPLVLLHSWSHTPGPQRGGLILNSFFSCGSHWICICPSLAGPAPMPAALRLQAAGAGSEHEPARVRRQRKEGEQDKLIRRRGKERVLHTEGMCTFSHLVDTRQILWPAYPNQNLGCPVPGAGGG